MKKQQPPKDLKTAVRIGYLLSAYINHTLTAAESQELRAWRTADDHNRALFQQLVDEPDLEKALEIYKQSDPETALKKTKDQLVFRKPRVSMSAWQVVTAACLLIAITIGFYYLRSGGNQPLTPIAAEPLATDVAPGSPRAMLILEDGRRIDLADPVRDTLIGSQAMLHASDDLLDYQRAGTSAASMHTLAVPAKGFFRLRLPDGTQVWLNAESSIRYPTMFEGNERRVEVTGETYFEVAHDASKPFRVTVNGVIIEAIGTAFNINAYPDEAAIIATLVEGKVKITAKKRATTYLEPGKQAEISGSSTLVHAAQIDEITAWKQGKFLFVDQPVTGIMRQVARWYGVKVIYQGNPVTQLNATLSRDLPVSKLLALLEKTGEVHFKIENNSILVKE